MEYQGFTNYATWNVALWLDNDKAMYDYWNAVAGRHLQAAENKISRLNTLKRSQRQALIKEEVIAQLATNLEEIFTRLTPKLKESRRVHTVAMSDLTRAELESVNWQEVAGGVVERVLEGA